MTNIDKEIKHRSRRGLLELDLFLSGFINKDFLVMGMDDKKRLLEFLMIDDMAMLDILQKKTNPLATHKKIVLKIESFNANALQQSRKR
ncbi:MAG: succinate dehydrogenase assembly factor 2 [Betaproteobacteria bacterium]|nr:succinate dehydrogenase assembly factor 2 [Betaproteobacteria bacterium]MCH9842350.1 succinate dehydrogenase assembly factor 2 [Betaproteobacteria bacterium]